MARAPLDAELAGDLRKEILTAALEQKSWNKTALVDKLAEELEKDVRHTWRYFVDHAPLASSAAVDLISACRRLKLSLDDKIIDKVYFEHVEPAVLALYRDLERKVDEMVADGKKLGVPVCRAKILEAFGETRDVRGFRAAVYDLGSLTAPKKQSRKRRK